MRQENPQKLKCHSMVNTKQPFLIKGESKDQYSKLFSDLLIPAIAHMHNTQRDKTKKEKKSDPSIFKTEGYLLSVGYRW